MNRLGPAQSDIVDGLFTNSEIGGFIGGKVVIHGEDFIPETTPDLLPNAVILTELVKRLSKSHLPSASFQP